MADGEKRAGALPTFTNTEFKVLQRLRCVEEKRPGGSTYQHRATTGGHN